MRRVERLTIHRVSYGTNEDKLSGTITFSAPPGKIEILLDEERCLAMIEVVADLIVETAKDTSHILVSEVLDRRGDMIRIDEDT